jgi:hypothetical protein
MTISTLPISRLIKVGISLSAQAAQAQNLSSLLILGSSTVIDAVTRMRSYSSLAQVATDFGTAAPEYLAAVLWFEQNPQPTGRLLIGSWINAASTAQLYGAPLSAAQQAISNFSGVANGGFNITTSKAPATPVIVPSAVATYSTDTYTFTTAGDTISGQINLQVGAGGAPFSVPIPTGTTLAQAVTLLNANATFHTTNQLTASTATNTLIFTGGAYGASGTKTIIDTSVLVDSTAQTLTGIVLTGVANLNAVASAINGVLTGATCAWNAAYGEFVFTTTATGVGAGISFATASGSGTDISSLIGCTATSSGAYTVGGQAAETALSAVTLFDSMFGQQWFGLSVLGAVTADHLAIMAYTEASANFHYYFATTQEAACYVTGATSSLAYQASQLAYNRSFVQNSLNNPYAAVSAAARILTTDYTGNNTVIDLMYKQEPGIVPEYLNSSQIAAAEAVNANVLVAYNNNTAIIDLGNSCSGLPAALVIGSMAFGVQLQTDLYNVLYTGATKIPQTDAGMHMLAAIIESDATQFVNNGFLAPGYWTGELFGTLTYNQYLAKGFYLYTPSVANQSTSNRAAGNSVPFQLAAKFSGAVRFVNLAVTINQ